MKLDEFTLSFLLDESAQGRVFYRLFNLKS